MNFSTSFQAKQYYLAILVAIYLAAVYVALIVQIDNTNLGTTNGLWKSPNVAAWENGTGTPADDGELIYLPTYGYLSRLIPDGWVQYGTHSAVVVFRKMAIWNGIFGGIASGLVFFMAYRFTQSAIASLVICFVHASAGFVLVNCLNSEDIIPGYTFFLAASASLFEYVASRRLFWIFLSGSFLAMATLLHWSLMGPGALALGLMLCLMTLKEPRQWRALALFAVTFLGVIQAVLLAGLVFGRYVPLPQIIYPGKLSAIGGWAGFHAEKVIYAAVGIGNYFSGANNLGDYHVAFSNATILREMLASWIFGVVTLAGGAWAPFDQRVPANVKLLAAFAWALFLVGEIPDLYGQPQDPQMQIEPMFATIAGLIILVCCLAVRLRRQVSRVMLAVLLAAGVSNAAWNLHQMEATRGSDSRAIAVTEQLAELFPPANTVMVWHGFEGETTWQYIITFRGDSPAFLSRSVHLASAFTNHAGISGEAAAVLMKNRIDQALARGDRVVAGALWTQTRSEFINSLTTVTSGENAAAYDDGLRGVYDLGRRWQTDAGPFVELLKKGTRTPAGVSSAAE